MAYYPPPPSIPTADDFPPPAPPPLTPADIAGAQQDLEASGLGADTSLYNYALPDYISAPPPPGPVQLPGYGTPPLPVSQALDALGEVIQNPTRFLPLPLGQALDTLREASTSPYYGTQPLPGPLEGAHNILNLVAPPIYDPSPLDIILSAPPAAALIPTVLRPGTAALAKLALGATGADIREPLTALGSAIREPLEQLSENLTGMGMNLGSELGAARIAGGGEEISAEVLARNLSDRPHASVGEAALRKAADAGYDVGAARDALDAYRGIQRSNTASYLTERRSAWSDFRDALSTLEKPASQEIPRAFAESLSESEATGPELRQFLTDNPLTYAQRRNTAQALADATAGVERDSQGVLGEVMGATRFGDKDSFNAIALIDRFQKDGMAASLAGKADEADAAFANAAMVARRAAESLTEAGRTVQAASALDRLSPEGVRMYVERTIQEGAARRGDAAVIKRLADEAERVQRQAIEEAAKKDLDWLRQVRKASARLQRDIDSVVYAAPGRYARTAIDFGDFRTAISSLLSDEGAAIRFKGRGPLSQADAQALWREAKRISDLPRGVEREAARTALESRLDTLGAQAGPAVADRRVEAALEAANRRALARERLLLANQEARVADMNWRENQRIATATQRNELLKERTAKRAEELAAARELAAAERAAKARQGQITYLTDADARIVQKRIVEDRARAIQLLRAGVRGTSLELPRPLAESFYERSQNLQQLDLGSPERYRAASALFADIANLIPPGRWDSAMDVLNIPRSVKTAWDFSAPLRQGMVLAAGHPRIFASDFKPMIRAAFDPEYMRDLDAWLHTRPLSSVGESAGLYLAPTEGSLNRREEAFMSRAARGLPGLAASERAYTTFLNKLRADVFDSVVESWSKSGLEPSERDLRDWAQFVNWASGRGSLPQALSRTTPLLSAVLFSPRFLASRLELPFAAGKAALSLLPSAAPPGMLYTPLAARQIARDLALFVGGGLTILGLAKLGGAEVEDDPRSADFGKIKEENTRFDVWAGEDQLARYVVQEVLGQRKTSLGRIVQADRNSVLGNFLRSKLSPTAGLLNDLRLGQRYGGGDVYGPAAGEVAFRDLPLNVQEFLKSRGWDPAAKPLVAAGEIGWNQLAPLAIQDSAEAFLNSSVPVAVTASVGTIFGLGVQSYQTIASIRDKLAHQAEPGKSYAQLDNAERRKINQSPEIQNAVEQQALQSNIDPNQLPDVALKLYKDRVEALEKDFLDAIPGMKNNSARRVYIQRFKEQVYSAAQTALANPEVQKQLGDSQFSQSADLLAQSYWSAPAPISPATGEPDFRAQDAARSAILQQALESGVDTNYIKGRGPDSFLRQSFEDKPEIRRYLEEYEAAQATVRPYFDLRQSVADSMGSDVQKALQTAQEASDGAERQKAQQSYAYRIYARMLERVESDYRRAHPDVNKVLVDWYNRAPQAVPGAPTLPLSPLPPLPPLAPSRAR